MNYFSKIEAYFSGELNELDRSVFEQELAENDLLQKELKAYQAAEELFNFTATHLSEEVIAAPTASELAEELINFTAFNLNEEEILAPTKIASKQEAIVHTLKPQPNRTAWLVAASMLLILSITGISFYNKSSQEIITPIAKSIEEVSLHPENAIVSTKILEEPIIKLPKTPSENKLVEKENIIKKAVIPSKTKPTIQAIAVKEPIKQLVASPISKNTTANNIATEVIISKGEAIAYKAENTVTLQPGFHAKAGSKLIAATNTSNLVQKDVETNTAITEKESVVFTAENSITLKPGFHAKAGSEFVASINL